MSDYQPQHARNRWRGYALAVLERAVKTAAQAALLVIGADQLNALAANWLDVLGFAAGGFVLSILTSLATSGVGQEEPPTPAAFGPETIARKPITQPHHHGERGATELEYLAAVAIVGAIAALLIVIL